VNKREGRRSRRVLAAEPEDVERPTERAAFRINLKDLRFLKSLGIDPTRKVRVRRTSSGRTRKAAR
jgi:hypothetical protein